MISIQRFHYTILCGFLLGDTGTMETVIYSFSYAGFTMLYECSKNSICFGPFGGGGRTQLCGGTDIWELVLALQTLCKMKKGSSVIIERGLPIIHPSIHNKGTEVRSRVLKRVERQDIVDSDQLDCVRILERSTLGRLVTEKEGHILNVSGSIPRAE